MNIDNSNKTSVTADEKSALDTLSECEPLFEKFDTSLFKLFGTTASTPNDNNKRKREEHSANHNPSPNDTTSLPAVEPGIQIGSQPLFPVADPYAVVDADTTSPIAAEVNATSPIAAAPGVDVAPGVDKAADIDADIDNAAGIVDVDDVAAYLRAANGDTDTAVERMMDDSPLGGDDANDVPVAKLEGDIHAAPAIENGDAAVDVPVAEEVEVIDLCNESSDEDNEEEDEEEDEEVDDDQTSDWEEDEVVDDDDSSDWDGDDN